MRRRGARAARLGEITMVPIMNAAVANVPTVPPSKNMFGMVRLGKKLIANAPHDPMKYRFCSARLCPRMLPRRAIHIAYTIVQIEKMDKRCTGLIDPSAMISRIQKDVIAVVNIATIQTYPTTLWALSRVRRYRAIGPRNSVISATVAWGVI